MPLRSSSVRIGFDRLIRLAESEFHSISTLVPLKSRARYWSNSFQILRVPSSALSAVPGNSVSAIIGKSPDV